MWCVCGGGIWTWVQVPEEEEGIRSSCDGANNGCKLSDVYAGNQMWVPMKEQKMFLATEPSLEPCNSNTDSNK